MSPGRSPLQRLVRLAVLAVFVVFAFWFLAGPNGLLSIARRKARERRLRADIAELKLQIDQEQQRRVWLENPDSAAKRAAELLGDKPEEASRKPQTPTPK